MKKKVLLELFLILLILFFMIKEISRVISYGVRYMLAGNVTKNFKWAEFDSGDGVKVPKIYEGNILELCYNLEVIRDYFGGRPIIINSGYRTWKHNKAVGGVENSQHLVGKAADIRIKGVTVQELYDGILKLISDGKIKRGGVGLYETFVHYDVRGFFTTWRY